MLSRGTSAARARELKTTASRRRERSDRGFRRRRIRESPPAPHPTVLATMLPPRSFCQDLARGKLATARSTRPRAETTASRRRKSSSRNFRGAERPSFQLSLKRGGSRRHMCPPVLASREIHLPTRTRRGKGGRGEPPRRLQKHGAVCADRLAKKRIARASGVFIGTVNLQPITRESPLRQSADRKKPAVVFIRPLVAPNSRN